MRERSMALLGNPLLANGLSVVQLAGLALAYFALGRKEESDEALAALSTQYEIPGADWVATVHAYRGEADLAFAWLAKADEHHLSGLGSLPFDQLLSKLHTDPRWLPFLRKIGYAPEQLAAIEFDVKPPEE